MLDMIKSQIGLVETLYEDEHNIENVNSIAVDRFGGIFWSADKYGKESGAIHKAKADSPSDDSVKQESKAFDKVSSLFYNNEFLFFIASDNDEERSDTSAIYYKNVPKTGEISAVVNKVTDGFEGLVSVATLDEFIYVADSD